MIDQIDKYIEENRLNTKSRKQELVYQRCYLYHYLRTFGISLQKIGKKFNKDHATIIHGLKQYDNLKNDEYFQGIIKDLTYIFSLNDLQINSSREMDMYKQLRNFNK